MIIGIGSDIVDIRRIEQGIGRFGDRFISRLYTPDERTRAEQKTGAGRIARYAKYFAAKEAAIKALGGSNGQGFGWTDFEVRYTAHGAPELHLSGMAGRVLQSRLTKGQQAGIHLSLSDEPPYAQAFVVIEVLRPALL